MRASWIALSFLVGISLISCAREDGGHRDDGAASQAGRDAYRASQQVKDGARRAAQDLDHASKAFRDGWEEAKRNDHTPRTDQHDDHDRH